LDAQPAQAESVVSRIFFSEGVSEFVVIGDQKNET
jgi:hypothetical protein